MILRLRGCVVDLDLREVRRDDGATEALTDKEVELLTWMGNRPGEVIPVEDLEREVWGFAPATLSRAVSAAVRRLRHKIEPTQKPVNLLTVFGTGWRLNVVEVLPAIAAPARPAPALPRAPENAFIGRDADARALASALAEGARLITIVGAAGVGKSRLVLEVLPTLASSFDGVVVCDLTGASTAEAWATAVCGALGVPVPVGDPQDAATALLHDSGSLLLILDDADEGGAGCPELVAGWVESCPELSVAVTHRAALGVPGEHLLLLGPLGIVAENGGESESPAVALLQARAAERRLTLPVDADTLALVEALDGLPLAIELAVPHLQVVPVRRFLDMLGDPQVLADERRVGPARHRSLLTALIASCEALPGPVLATLEAVGVFRRFFDVDDAIEVVGSPAGEVMLALSELLTRGLLVRTTRGDLAVLGALRAWLGRRGVADASVHERYARWVVRDLDVPVEQALPDAVVERADDLQHAARVTEGDLAARAAWLAAAAFRESGQSSVAADLVRRGMEQVSDPGLFEALLLERVLLCNRDHGLDEVRTLQGLLASAVMVDPDRRALLHLLVSRALDRHLQNSEALAEIALAPTCVRGPVRVRVLRVSGLMKVEAGDRDEGLALLDEAVAVAIRLNMEQEQAWALASRASYTGDLGAVDEVLTLLERLDERGLYGPDRSLLLANAGSLGWQAGEGRRTLDVLERAVDLAARDGHVIARAEALTHMALVLGEQGRFRTASEAIYEASRLDGKSRLSAYRAVVQARISLLQGHLVKAAAAIEVASRTSHRILQRIWSHELRAELLVLAQQPAEATVHARSAVALADEVGLDRHKVVPNANLARALRALGELDEAEQVVGAAVQAGRRTRIPFDLTMALVARAEVAHDRGDRASFEACVREVQPLLDRMDIQACSPTRSRVESLVARSSVEVAATV